MAPASANATKSLFAADSSCVRRPSFTCVPKRLVHSRDPQIQVRTPHYVFLSSVAAGYSNSSRSHAHVRGSRPCIRSPCLIRGCRGSEVTQYDYSEVFTIRKEQVSCRPAWEGRGHVQQLPDAKIGLPGRLPSWHGPLREPPRQAHCHLRTNHDAAGRQKA